MGLKEWAEKNKAGSPEQLAQKAERIEKRAGLKADHAANKAESAERRENLKAEWTEHKAGSQERVAKKDERAEKLVNLKADMAANKARADAAGMFEGVVLKFDSVKYKGQGGPVSGATAHVETASDVRRRVTATRALAIGVFALAAKKKAGHIYLTVEHPDYFFTVEVPVKKETKAREFAAKINNAGRQKS